MYITMPKLPCVVIYLCILLPVFTHSPAVLQWEIQAVKNPTKPCSNAIDRTHSRLSACSIHHTTTERHSTHVHHTSSLDTAAHVIICLTLWRPLLPYGYSYKASSPECQSAQMSKITNAGLTQSATGCFIAVLIWQQWLSKG